MLDAFQDDSDDIPTHQLHVDGSKVVAVDRDQVPTGPFIDITGTADDYREAQAISNRINDIFKLKYCGTGCVGCDNCWIYDKSESSVAGVSLWSDVSGIR